MGVTALWPLFGFLWLPVASATVTTLTDADPPATRPATTVSINALLPPANTIQRAAGDESVHTADAGRRARAGSSAAPVHQLAARAAFTRPSTKQLSAPSSAGAAAEPSRPKIATALLVAVGLLGLLYNYGRRRF